MSEMRVVFPDTTAVDNLIDHYPWPNGRWVRASMVSTVDGAGFGPDHRSGSISTPADFALFVALRNNCDAIIVGAGTARAEGYRPPKSARLVVVTASGRLSPSLPFVADASPERRPIVFTSESADTPELTALHGRVDIVRAGQQSVDLDVGLNVLEDRGLKRFVVEGGPRLLGDLVGAHLIDELDVQITPLLAGGAFADGTRPERMLGGQPLPGGLTHLHLAQVITDGATLFLRYLKATEPHQTRDGS